MPRTADRVDLPRRVARKRHPFWSLYGVVKYRPAADRVTSSIAGILTALMILSASAPVWAIPPNTPITNVARAAYQVDGVDYFVDASDTVITDGAAGNSPPYGIAVAPSSVAENAVGVRVGTLSAFDPDPDDSHTYAVSDPRFAVVGGELFLAPGVSFDFETETAATITVRVTDSAGAAFEQPLTVTITNVNEAPTAITLDNSAVVAGQPGAPVGVLATADPDAGDSHTYQVDDPRFAVTGNLLQLNALESLALGEVAEITVTATDTGGLTYQQTFTITGTVDGGGNGTNSSIAFLQHAPGSAGAGVLDTAIARCGTSGSTAGPFVALDAISDYAGTPIPVPAALPLTPTSVFKSKDVLFFQVADPDADTDGAARDSLLVRLTTDSGDEELIEAQETEIASGVFAGYVQTVTDPAARYDCVVSAGVDERVTATYRDALDAADVAVTAALVDPLGRVFDSASGRPIDGAVITLVDAAGGTPANVYSDDPAVAYPATVTSGGTAVDGGGVTHDFLPGTYRYPQVRPGDYQLRVTPPNRFAFPSTASDAAINQLPGAPFALGPGSRGAPFSIPVGPAVRIDIPLDLLPVTPTAASGRLSTLSPGHPAAVATPVSQGACFDGSAYVPTPGPSAADGSLTALPAVLDLLDASRFRRNDAVFVSVTDPDQDLDPFAADAVEIDIIVAGGDAERLRLIESGASTGVFSGHLQTGIAAPVAQDCVLDGAAGSEFTVRYVDPDDAGDAVDLTGVLDAGFTVFNAQNGAPVDGVLVTLVDAATGAPALGAVFGSAADAVYPVTVTTGGSATDGAGVRFDFAPGSVQFPLIQPGRYRLEVEPGATYRFPSAVSDQAIAVLPTGPFVLTAGSRGEPFDVFGGVPAAFDVPVDPVTADLVVTKESSRQTASVGDFVQYRVAVQNSDASGAVAGLAIHDVLPPGFRYVAGSARADDARVDDPSIGAEGRALTFSLSALPAGGTVVLTYVTEVTVGAANGLARNTASVTGIGVGSANTAFADVVVREDLLISHGIIAGRVVEGCDSRAESGVADVRILMEDGTYVLTDASGNYHIEGVTPGTHVVQLDATSLPDTHEVAACGDNAGIGARRNTRNAGGVSQFVELGGGALWRADFFVSPRPPVTEQVRARLLSEAIGGRIDYTFEVVGGEIPLSNVSAIVMLPKGLSYVGGTSRLSGVAIDDPQGAATGALTYRLPNSAGAFTTTVEFQAFAQQGDEEVVAKGMLMVEAESGRVRTPVIENRLQLDGPGNLMQVGETRTLFDEARADLKPVERQKLSSMGDKVRSASDLYVDVVGHADARPLRSAVRSTYLDNYELSRARADAVARYVGSELAVPAARMKVSGRGAEEPVASNASEAGRAQNRRVDVSVFGRSVVPDNETTRADSGYEVVEVTQARTARPRTGVPIPEIDNGGAPEFDSTWLRNQSGDFLIAWPPDRHNARSPSIEVAAIHPAGHRVELLVDGKLVNPLTFEGTTVDRDRDLAVSAWNNITIRPGDNEIQVQVLDEDGRIAHRLVRNAHFSGAPIRAELVEELSSVVADGITPPVVAVRLWDRDGYHARPGTTGEFAVLEPYRAFDDAKHLNSFEDSFQQSAQRYLVRKDGVAYIRLEPTTDSGEVELRFDFDEHRVQDLRTRVEPGARDWVLVGVGVGTVGYNTLSGNVLGLENTSHLGEDVDVGDDLYVDGRLAFYAKGMIPGDILLTLAYDSDKDVDGQLRRQIDPGRFYTLYGDASEQRYDAESARRLFVRMERSDFTALVGDLDTGFDETELTRYARTLNGAQGHYYGEHVEAKRIPQIAAEADQGFVRDEFQGDGTSGVYRLSERGIIVNSERISIVTRNRFQLDKIIEQQSLTRYQDYSIDFELGHVIFKQPIFSQDESFNPVFIVAEYEVEAGSDDDLLVGGRAAYRLADDSEVALTYINDGADGRGGELLGADLVWRAGPTTELRLEAAQSDTDEHGRANAYLAELEHQGADLAGRVFYREQRDGFGLGQQTVLEANTRRYGVEGEYRVRQDLTLRGETFQQKDLASGGERLLASGEAEYRIGQTRLGGGLRLVRENTADGQDADGNQLTLSASRPLLDDRMLLRTDAEFELGGGSDSADYPSRAIVGAEYELFNGVAFIAEQELTWGDARDTQDTRFGVKARPWNGADLSSNLERRITENGERLFATTGLLQQWRLDDAWLLDVGTDRVQTIKESGEPDTSEALLFNPRQPTASGSVDGDFTAVFAGVGYRQDSWDVSTRMEYHTGDVAEKWNYLLGVSRQLDAGKVMSGSISVLNEDGADGIVRDETRVRWGTAWRPTGSRWMFLNRLDLVLETTVDPLFDTDTAKLVNNFNANFQPDERSQLSLQAAVKHVVDDIDGESYRGTTAVLGGEYRYDLSPRWDVGVRGAILESLKSNVRRYSAGISVGRNLYDNFWISAGYNFFGFDDEDFVAADYTAKGPFLKLRFKLDQELMRTYLRPVTARGSRAR